MTKIPFTDFQKVDLRVGTILEVENHPKADKLYILKVNLGEETPRTIVAGLRNHYTQEDLKGQAWLFTAFCPDTGGRPEDVSFSSGAIAGGE